MAGWCVGEEGLGGEAKRQMGAARPEQTGPQHSTLLPLRPACPPAALDVQATARATPASARPVQPSAASPTLRSSWPRQWWACAPPSPEVQQRRGRAPRPSLALNLNQQRQLWACAPRSSWPQQSWARAPPCPEPYSAPPVWACAPPFPDPRQRQSWACAPLFPDPRQRQSWACAQRFPDPRQRRSGHAHSPSSSGVAVIPRVELRWFGCSHGTPALCFSSVGHQS